MKNILYKSIGAYLNTAAAISPKKGGEMAFKLFCTPQRPKLKSHHLDFLKSGDFKNLSFNGMDIKLYKWGRGPKNVLFIHGWQSHTYRWKKYIQSLPEDEYSVYAFDAPGHGLSSGNKFTVPLNAYLISGILAEIKHLDTIVAHSIGGMSVFYYLAHYPPVNIARIVAMALPGRVDDFVRLYSGLLGLSPRLLRNIENEFRLYVKQDLEQMQTAKWAEKSSIPGLIIHDRNDCETLFHHAVNLEKSWQGSKLIPTEGLGHNLRSEDVVNLISDYIKNEGDLKTIENSGIEKGILAI